MVADAGVDRHGGGRALPVSGDRRRTADAAELRPEARERLNRVGQLRCGDGGLHVVQGHAGEQRRMFRRRAGEVHAPRALGSHRQPTRQGQDEARFAQIFPLARQVREVHERESGSWLHAGDRLESRSQLLHQHFVDARAVHWVQRARVEPGYVGGQGKALLREDRETVHLAAEQNAGKGGVVPLGSADLVEAAVDGFEGNFVVRGGGGGSHGGGGGGSHGGAGWRWRLVKCPVDRSTWADFVLVVPKSMSR